MIEVSIEGRVFLARADQDRVDPDHAAAFADHFDLFVANVALDVVKLPGVRVRNDQRLSRKIDNLFEPGRINVGKIDNQAELFTFADKIATERR